MASLHFEQLPYTIKVVTDLMIKGYYLESMILIRHLLEALIQIKYYTKYPEKILFKNRVYIDNMIEDLSKPLRGCYTYLCKYAHGYIMKGVHRIDIEKREKYDGCWYSDSYFFRPVYFVTATMMGFINSYNTIFIENTFEENLEARELKRIILDWCVSAREKQIKTNNISNKWNDAIDKLIL